MIRRAFLTGLGSLLAAPAIVHAGNLMPVRAVRSSMFVVHEITVDLTGKALAPSVTLYDCARGVLRVVPMEADINDRTMRFMFGNEIVPTSGLINVTHHHRDGRRTTQQSSGRGATGVWTEFPVIDP